LLKDNEKLDSAHFWGKIFGIQKDYLIAQATFPNETIFKRKFYYRYFKQRIPILFQLVIDHFN
jgi:hypothetical protein